MTDIVVTLFLLFCIGSFFLSFRPFWANVWIELTAYIVIGTLFLLGWMGAILDNSILFMSPFFLITGACVLWLLYSLYVNVRFWWGRPKQATHDGQLLLVEDGDDWEQVAIALLRQKNELSAIELVQDSTGLDFEQSRVKLFKLKSNHEMQSQDIYSHNN